MQPESSSTISKVGPSALQAPMNLPMSQPEATSLVFSPDQEAEADSANFYDAFVDGLFATSATIMPRLSAQKLENKGFDAAHSKAFDFDMNSLQGRDLLHEFLSSSEARRRGFTSRKAQPFEVVGFMDVDAKRAVRPIQLKVRKKQSVKGFNNILSLEYWRGEGSNTGSSSSTAQMSPFPVTDCSC